MSPGRRVPSAQEDLWPSAGASVIMPHIVLQRIGSISEDTVRIIKGIVEECYQRLEPHGVDLLDLLLFESSALMNAFYARERQGSGVMPETLSEQFSALHDAWKGTPRIGICLERMEDLPQPIAIGTLRHEVAHSVLHGSIEHYVFSITPPLLKASERFGISKESSFSILYALSIAVKDFEATRLLVEKEYVEDQLAYSRHVLTTSQDDLSVWRMAQGNSAAVALCAASRLKDAACTMAIEQVLQRSPVETLKKEFSYFPDRVLDSFLHVVEALPQHMTGDTLHNVGVAVRLFVEMFLEPVFSESFGQS